MRRTTETLRRNNAAVAADVMSALPRQRRPAPQPVSVEPVSVEPVSAEPESAEPDSPKAPPPASAEPRGVLHRLWRIVTGLLLIAAAVGAVSAMVIVMTQHLGFAPVLSPSMEPTFHPGDLIVTRPEPATSVRVGQVVALPVPSEPSQRYVHRVISVTIKDGKPLVRTKGDANPAPEPFTLRVDSPTVPHVVATVPYVGRLSLLLQHTKTRLAVIVITIAAMLLAAWRMLAGAPRKRGRHG